MQRSALNAPTGRPAGSGTTGPTTRVGAGSADIETAGPVGSDLPADDELVVVHVQLRPRRGATRKCLAALAALAAEHDGVSFTVTGLSKDDRVVRVTVGIDLGPRAGVAKFSPQAQAAYAFVSALFTSLYDHMPVYTAEPSEAERAAAAALLDVAVGGRADLAGYDRAGYDRAGLAVSGTGTAAEDEIPAPRSAGWGARVSA
jgi:hypothetical protein